MQVEVTGHDPVAMMIDQGGAHECAVVPRAVVPRAIGQCAVARRAVAECAVRRFTHDQRSGWGKGSACSTLSRETARVSAT